MNQKRNKNYIFVYQEYTCNQKKDVKGQFILYEDILMFTQDEKQKK